jgi:hypothetical protein
MYNQEKPNKMKTPIKPYNPLYTKKRKKSKFDNPWETKSWQVFNKESNEWADFEDANISFFQVVDMYNQEKPCDDN